MLLDEWLQTNNITLKRFERALLNPRTGEPYSYTTLFRIAHLHPCDSYLVAKSISDATGGEVSIAEVADPDVIAKALRARAKRGGDKIAPPSARQARAAKPSKELPMHVQPLRGAAAPRAKRKRAAASGGSPEAA